MAKSSASHEQHELDSYLKTVKGESISYPHLFDLIAHIVPHAQGVIVTSLPRGSLQIAQPADIPEGLLKSYSKDFHAFDRPTWMAISRQAPVRATDCWDTGQYDSSRYVREFLAPNGLQYSAAAPLTAPVLNGYAGALMLFRSAEQGKFTDLDLSRMGEIAQLLDEAIGRTRSVRRTRTSTTKSLRPK